MAEGFVMGRGTPNGALLRHLNSVVIPFEGEGCLVWPFARTSNGYARVRVDGVMHGVHRLVCERIHGPAPTPDHQAAHSCGKGHLGCVNPKHLSWKTPAENQADRLIHGTHRRGERHSLSKLKSADVERIRALEGKLLQRKIAMQFGISRSLVSRIQSGHKWPTSTVQPRPPRRPRRLTLETATEVAVRRLRGETCRVIARDFGVSENLPREIVKGRAWATALAAATEIIKNG